MEKEATKVGKRGTVVIPAGIRRQYGFEEGVMLLAEGRPEGILLRPVLALPYERYTPTRKAEFLLNNAITSKDYAWAVKEVRKMGLDPRTIPHEKPRAR